MMKSKIGILLLALVAAACNHSATASSASTSPASLSHESIDNGRSIFLTGRDSAGVQIVAASPPLRPSCAACHRSNGAGGVHLPGGAVSADLRNHALVAAQGKHPYTVALLERAISTGIDNTGQPLNRVMPHWKLSNRDLHDVAQYVFTQLK